MTQRRVLLAVTIGALLAVAVALPALAGLAGRDAADGHVQLYRHEIARLSADGSPQYTPTGPSSVRLTYAARVTPYSLTWTLAAGRLQPRTPYALVNVVDFWGSDTFSFNFWQVKILATAVTTRHGMLTMRGSGTTLKEPTFVNWPYRYNYWFRFPGAEVWLVPAADILQLEYKTSLLDVLPTTDGPRGFAVADTWWLAAAGLPVDPDDFNVYGAGAGAAPAPAPSLAKPLD